MLPSFNKMSQETFSHLGTNLRSATSVISKPCFCLKTMSVLIAGHSQVKYLNQYTQDTHVSCIARPGGKIRDIFSLINEAVSFFDVSINFIVSNLLQFFCG